MSVPDRGMADLGSRVPVSVDLPFGRLSLPISTHRRLSRAAFGRTRWLSSVVEAAVETADRGEASRKVVTFGSHLVVQPAALEADVAPNPS